MTTVERLERDVKLLTKCIGMHQQIDEIGRELLTVLRDGGTIYTCGNGGSMAQAQHFVGELVGRFQRERPGLSAVALGSNPATTSAVTNDYGAVDAFARELGARGTPNDALVCLSTSGKSTNILNVMDVAHKIPMLVVLLTGVGAGVGELACMAEVNDAGQKMGYAVCVPSTYVASVQVAHLSIIHALCAILDEAYA